MSAMTSARQMNLVVGRGMAQSGVRLVNERTILRIIGNNPGVSNADLARLSGLGAQTTSRIVADLEVRGLVARGEVLRGNRGQPPTPLTVKEDGAFSIGVELGWKHYAVVLVGLTGAVIKRIEGAYDFPDARSVLPMLAAIVRDMIDATPEPQRSRIDCFGVSSPSTIARNIGSVGGSAEQARLWESIDIARELGTLVGAEFTWFNDGNAACWAEYVAQPRPRPLDLVYFNIGTFVGGGVIADGVLWEGPGGNAGNLGSIMVSDRDGQPTFVHQVASLWALQNLIVSRGLPSQRGLPADWDWAAIEPAIVQWIEEAGRALAKAVVTSQAFVEYRTAVIDAAVPCAIVERLLASTRQNLDDLPAFTAEKPVVTTGHFGLAAAAVGSAQLPLFRRYYDRNWSQVTL